jgi:hypothetical protein
MYLFSRRRQIDTSQLRAALGFSVDIAHKVNQVTGIEVSTYLSTFSRDFGTVLWGCAIPDLEAFEAANDKLMTENTYLDAVEQSDRFFRGGVSDTMSVLVHGEITAGRRPEYVSVVQSTAANGSLAGAMAAGVEIAQRATAITGIETLFLSETTNGYGSVSWVAGVDSIRDVERGQQQLATDAGWLELIDAHGRNFTEGTTTTLYRRLG